LNEAKKFLEGGITTIETVEFCLIDDETIDYFQKEFAGIEKYPIK